MPSVLVVEDDEDLVELVNELGELGAQHDIVPYLAADADAAYEIQQDEGPELMLAVLQKDQLDIYDGLMGDRYLGDFLVIAPKGARPQWEDREVEFINGVTEAETLYEKILEIVG